MLRNMRLVGREHELAVVRGAVDSADAGASAVLVLLGEAGIGKTSLLEAAVAEAQARGFELRAGRATEHEADVPLLLFTGALPPGAVAPPSDSPWERWRLFRSLADELTGGRASASPVVVALDDVHWADPASLELVDALVRRPPASTLLLLTLRPGAVADEVLMAARSSTRPVQLVELRSLTREAAQQLMADRPSTESARLFESSGGNPLLLTELLRVGTDSALPPGLLAAVVAELARLAPVARTLLESGALIGDPFVVDLAAGAGDLSDEEWSAGLDELLAHGLLVPAGSPREFRFRHPVVRTVVYDGMSAAVRLQRHARAADELARLHRPAVDRARHLAHAATPGDIRAATTLREGAEGVRARAPSIAADWLLVAKMADPPRETAHFADLAQVLVQSGRLGEALAIADEGLAFGSGKEADRLRVTLMAASVERQLGEHESSRRRLVRALEEGPTGPVRADLLGNLALSAYESGDYVAVADWSAQLRTASPDDRVLRAMGDVLAAMLLRFHGDVSASGRLAQDAILAIRDVTDDELAARAELVTAIPWALVALELFTPAGEISRRASTAARRAGNLSASVPLALPEVLALALLGRLESADEAAQQAEATARLTRNEQATQWALWARAWVLLERGLLPEALAAATESVAIAERLDDSSLATVGRAVLGSVLLADGQAAAAVPLLAAYDVEPTWICRWAPHLVEALLADSALDAAGRAAQRAATLAGESGLRGAAAAAHRAVGLVALADGEPERALAEAVAAIDAAVAIGASHDEAHARLLAGRSDSDLEEAARQFREAHRLAELCGALRSSADLGPGRARTATDRTTGWPRRRSGTWQQGCRRPQPS